MAAVSAASQISWRRILSLRPGGSFLTKSASALPFVVISFSEGHRDRGRILQAPGSGYHAIAVMPKS